MAAPLYDAPVSIASQDGIQTDPRALAIQRLRLKRDFRGTLAAGLLAIAVTVAIWALAGGGYFWPVWVILGVAISLIVTGWKAYGPSGPITEDEIQQEMQKG